MQLSQGDSKKFYLYPINEMLQLKIVRLTAPDTEERARWYKALQQVTKNNNVIPMRQESIANLDEAAAQAMRVAERHS